MLEAKLAFRPWFGRVPTASKVADGPSRLDCRFVGSLGSVLHPFKWKDVAGKWCETKRSSQVGKLRAH